MTEKPSSLDWVLIAVVAFLIVPFAALSNTARDWMLQHAVVVPAEQSVVSVPGWGIGLDWPRILLVIATVAILSTISFAARRRSKIRRQRLKREGE